MEFVERRVEVVAESDVELVKAVAGVVVVNHN